LASKVKLKKDNGDGSFDIVWLEDEAEDTANLEDLKRLGMTRRRFPSDGDGHELMVYPTW
jgi:hypothetical protein